MSSDCLSCKYRNFRDPQHAYVTSNKPLYGGAGVGGAASSTPWPIIIGIAAVILIIIAVLVAIVLALLLPSK